MQTLTVNEHGQVTFDREVLKHLGIGAVGEVQIDLLPGGRVELRAKPKGTFRDLRGMLKGKTNGRVFTIEEIGEMSGPPEEPGDD